VLVYIGRDAVGGWYTNPPVSMYIGAVPVCKEKKLLLVLCRLYSLYGTGGYHAGKNNANFARY
jgi:hypothetical protein